MEEKFVKMMEEAHFTSNCILDDINERFNKKYLFN
jgi:hypothetical protein